MRLKWRSERTPTKKKKYCWYVLQILWPIHISKIKQKRVWLFLIKRLLKYWIFPKNVPQIFAIFFHRPGCENPFHKYTLLYKIPGAVTGKKWTSSKFPGFSLTKFFKVRKCERWGSLNPRLDSNRLTTK